MRLNTADDAAILAICAAISSGYVLMFAFASVINTFRLYGAFAFFVSLLVANTFCLKKGGHYGHHLLH